MENVTKTYICDSCGGISTITWDKGRCNFCGSATHLSPEDAIEIPIPRCEFGTEFVAVVYRGKVVDILVLSDRTSVHDFLCHDGLVRVQDYVDQLEPGNESSKGWSVLYHPLEPKSPNQTPPSNPVNPRTVTPPKRASFPDACGVCGSFDVYFDRGRDFHICGQCGAHETTGGWQKPK